METSAVTLIFILGGITFLVNWMLFFRGKEVPAANFNFLTFKRFVLYFTISSLGVLISGVIFVSIFMLAHG